MSEVLKNKSIPLTAHTVIRWQRVSDFTLRLIEINSLRKF